MSLTTAEHALIHRFFGRSAGVCGIIPAMQGDIRQKMSATSSAAPTPPELRTLMRQAKSNALTERSVAPAADATSAPARLTVSPCHPPGSADCDFSRSCPA